jgi:hypothetical protein
MGICARHRRKGWWPAVLLLIAFVMAGCAGIEPYEPRNNREEGPEKGIFTGSEGEWVIFRKANEPEKDSEDKKSPDETKDNETKDEGQSQGSE